MNQIVSHQTVSDLISSPNTQATAGVQLKPVVEATLASINRFKLFSYIMETPLRLYIETIDKYAVLLKTAI